MPNEAASRETGLCGGLRPLAGLGAAPVPCTPASPRAETRTALGKQALQFLGLACCLYPKVLSYFPCPNVGEAEGEWAEELLGAAGWDFFAGDELCADVGLHMDVPTAYNFPSCNGCSLLVILQLHKSHRYCIVTPEFHKRLTFQSKSLASFCRKQTSCWKNLLLTGVLKEQDKQSQALSYCCNKGETMEVLFVLNSLSITNVQGDIQTDLRRNQARIPVEAGVTALSGAFGRLLGKGAGSKKRYFCSASED